MKRLLFAGALVLALSGCEGLTQATGDPTVDAAANAVKRVGIACDSYSSSLNVLAVMNSNGQLSAESETRVDQIVATVGPLCRSDAQPVSAEVADILATIEPLVYELVIMKDPAT